MPATSMTVPLAASDLDDILAIQLGVAWAGEGRCEPRRLGWWETDLIDPRGGGDLMARLLPRTAPWAGLEAVREAAMRVDRKARGALPDPDKVRTLYFLGFATGEQLADRLRQLKASGEAPSKALRLLADPFGAFDPAGFANALQALASDCTYTVVPAGRQMRAAPPDTPVALVRALAACLAPFQPSYPMPFFRLPT